MLYVGLAIIDNSGVDSNICFLVVRDHRVYEQYLNPRVALQNRRFRGHFWQADAIEN